MPQRLARAAALATLLGWPAADARAWTDATRLRMIKDALKATPPAMCAMLESRAKDLAAGMLEPSRHEDEEVHYQLADGRGGLAAEAVFQKEEEIRGLLRARRSIRRVCYECGFLAHLVSDVDFPLNASDSDPREPLYREPYRKYIEMNLDKIPFVLDRDPSPEIDRDDVRGFILARARRAGRNYALIGPAFKDDGTPRSPAAVDDKSVPFGIASLSYSSAVSDIVRVWTHLWKSINGDLQGTPYLNAPPPEKVKLPERRPRKKQPPAARPSPSPSPPPAPSGSPSPSASPAPSASPSPAPATAEGGH
jgi:hypothetical protein